MPPPTIETGVVRPRTRLTSISEVRAIERIASDPDRCISAAVYPGRAFGRVATPCRLDKAARASRRKVPALLASSARRVGHVACSFSLKEHRMRTIAQQG